MAEWRLPHEFPPEFNRNSPAYRAAEARQAILGALNQAGWHSGDALDLIAALDALIDARNRREG